MSTPEVVRSQDWYDEQDTLERERLATAPEFGVTLADAAKLMRKAKRVWVMFNIGPGDRMGIFEIPKSVINKEIKLYQGGAKTFRPCELDHTTHDGPTLIFGSHEAGRRAVANPQEGALADARS